MKTLDFPCELKQLDDTPGAFEGHASVFGEEDHQRDIVMRGAFKRSLAEQKERGRMPALLWQHDSTMPIGVWTEMKEDRRGLFVRGQLLVDEVQMASEAHALLKAGALSGLSIGFMTVESDTDERTGLRKLRDIDLWETSLVTFPALDSARVATVKELIAEDIRTKKDLEDALRDAGFSKALAAYVVAGWQPPARRDAEGECRREIRDSIERLKRLLVA